ncbi:MAG: 30S ribosomal protein S8 [Candidatus Pacebacteria bacterium]|nr:30S ribosomal protein S8 [Candidatus Paceibacterota bacterium]
MTDPIADMLNRIKNAQAVGKPTVEFPFSNLKGEVAKILEKQGFIEKIEKKGRKTKKTIEITLKYDNKMPVILGLKKVSKPGQRIYLNSTKIKKVKDGYGIAIISTSKGLLTDKEARKQKIGGEVLCEIW